MSLWSTFFILALVISSCKKKNSMDHPDEQRDTLDTMNYIPREGIHYYYTLTDADGTQHSYYKMVTGNKDSAGISVWEVTTYLAEQGQEISLSQNVFSEDAFTVTEIRKTDQWEQYINMMRASVEESGGEVLDVKLTGAPFYMLMENDPKVGSPLNFTGALEQKLYIKMRSGSGENATIIESSQTISRSDGVAVKAESITVPAGTFECMKWEYSVDNHVETKINGSPLQSLDTHDFITVWTTPRIGEVKTVTLNNVSGQNISVLKQIGQ